MSSALLWVPAGKYDSVSPLWQDQYIWSPVPVDKSLPLHQTSFLEIDESEAATAVRSRANTSTSNTTRQNISALVSERVLDHEAGERDAAELDQAMGIKGRHHGSTSAFLVAPAKRQPLTPTVENKPKGTVLRPDLSKAKRLRSFHLLRKARTGSFSRPAALETYDQTHEKTSVAVTKAPEAPGEDEEPTLTETSAGKEACGDTAKEPSKGTSQRSVGNQRARPRQRKDRLAKVKAQRGIDDTHKPDTKVQQALIQAPIESQQQPLSNTPSGSQSMSLKLDLNLDIEVQLKVTLRGDLTLSLMN
ncbi:hypothetical protein JX266_005755 [Neoarthrinium moseri]|nr:hypothetical protein JX266_005755 [Neoarthrinium moseri]